MKTWDGNRAKYMRDSLASIECIRQDLGGCNYFLYVSASGREYEMYISFNCEVIIRGRGPKGYYPVVKFQDFFEILEPSEQEDILFHLDIF